MPLHTSDPTTKTCFIQTHWTKSLFVEMSTKEVHILLPIFHSVAGLILSGSHKRFDLQQDGHKDK
jgi:hypothetical protein